MKRKFHIAVTIERTSEFGRRFLQGVADFFDGKVIGWPTSPRD